MKAKRIDKLKAKLSVHIPHYYVQDKNTFILKVITCKSFLEDGIRPGSELVFSQDRDFEEGKISVFYKDIGGENRFKLSKTLLEDYEYVGQLVLIISKPDLEVDGVV